MRHILITTTFILKSLLLAAQTCLPGGITFTTQAEVDAFPTNYPGCTTIEGNVIVNDGDNNAFITNLNGLSNITSISGDLTFHLGCDGLANMEGLNNLTTIGGRLEIFDCDGLISLTGLDNLTSVGGRMDIHASDALVNLSGLDNLLSIGGLCQIHSNDAQTSMDGLGSLTSVGGDFDIYDNPVLTNLDGITALTAVGDRLSIFLNSVLSLCNGQGICDYLANPANPASIHDNAPGCNSRVEVETTCANPGCPFEVVLTTQAEVDAFVVNYPNCTMMSGNVTINDGDNNAFITNLNGLSNLTSIDGNLSAYLGCDGLTNLNGLNNLTTIGGRLEIFDCDGLISLNGLDNLTSVGGRMDIHASDALANLTGLDNLLSIGGLCQIHSNDAQTSMDGLGSLTSVGGDFDIYDNALLTNLDGLMSLTTVGDRLSIFENSLLSVCNAQSICDYLANPANPASIHDNAPGCNSRAEVEAACLPCPTLDSTPPEVSIVNSVCSTGCVLAGGVITAPTGSPCPAGYSIQYSTNGGATWSSELPVYDQDGPAQTIKTRCSCNADNTLYSPASAGATTAPGICAPPSFTACPSSPLTASTDLGQCAALVNYSVAASGTPAPALTYALTGQTTGSGTGTGSGSTFNKGNTLVTVTAANVCSPAATCQFTVTVADNQPPSITCPANIVRNTDAGQCSALTTYSVTASDNCPGATTSVTAGLHSGSSFPMGMTSVVWKATDSAGLSATCQFTVTVSDNQPPSITCPSNLVRSADAGQCSAVVSYASPTFSDNCTGASIAHIGGLASGSAFPKGTNMVQWKAADAAGLSAVCQFTVTVNDTQVPSIGCPSNITKGNDAGQCSAVVNYTAPTASDNCPNVTAAHVSGGTSGSAFPKGQTTVVWRATDAAGLTKTCSFRITVTDTQLPTISCPSSQSLNTDAELCSAVVTYTTPTATDNCPPPLTVVKMSGLASGSAFPKGANTVVWKAIDGAGLTKTCSFTVTVTDTQLPTITCPANLSVTGSGNPCTATVTYATPTAIDNCAVQSVFLLSGQVSGSNFPAGTTTNVWRAVDNSGLSATCAFTVTVGCGTGSSEFEVRSLKLQSGMEWSSQSHMDLHLSPNPAAEQVQISMEGWGETGGDLRVTDAQGRTVWQQQLSNPTIQQLSVADFAPGLYFVTLHSEGRVVTKRLVVARL